MTKIKPADKAFADCVKAKAGYRCERCGNQYQKGDSGLHCSHIFSRRHRTIRWCKDNAQSLCFGCHQWFGGNPVESGAWVEQFVGESVIAILINKKNSRVKVSKLEEKDIAKHYRQQLKLIQAGAEDFESWQ